MEMRAKGWRGSVVRLLGLSGYEEQRCGTVFLGGMAVGEGLYNFNLGLRGLFLECLVAGATAALSSAVSGAGARRLDLVGPAALAWGWLLELLSAGAGGCWRKDMVAVFCSMRERLRRPVWASWLPMELPMMSATQRI
ncbi:hypothetical protein Q9L58_010110, partial [Maublancomyces gigas]